MSNFSRRCYLEINVDNIAHNVRTVLKHLGNSTKLMAILKGDGYGLGAVRVAKICQCEGVSNFGVATVEEAVTLRQSGIEGEILVLSYTPPERVEVLSKYNIAQAIISEQYAVALNDAASTRMCRINCHLKVDTGMGRIGVPWQSGYLNEAKRILELPWLGFMGVFSHLSNAEDASPRDIEQSRLQLERFNEFCHNLESEGYELGKRHLVNSAGSQKIPEGRLDMVRVGSSLYGLPTAEGGMFDLELRPTFEFKSVVTMIKSISVGVSIGYDSSFTAKRDTIIATVSAGYADGYRKCLSGTATVNIRGRNYPVIGAVCMDQLTVDITDAPNVSMGDEVLLIGGYGEQSPTILAKNAGGALGYLELLSGLNPRD